VKCSTKHRADGRGKKTRKWLWLGGLKWRVGYLPDRQELAGFRAAVMQPFDTHDEARRALATW